MYYLAGCRINTYYKLNITQLVRQSNQISVMTRPLQDNTPEYDFIEQNAA